MTYGAGAGGGGAPCGTLGCGLGGAVCACALALVRNRVEHNSDATSRDVLGIRRENLARRPSHSQFEAPRAMSVSLSFGLQDGP